jgi:hypothetical protein
MDLERLVDALVETREPGFGYSGYFSGSEFLPYEDSGQMGTLVLGASRAERSEPLRKIVAQGVHAVPVLLRHIDDDRKIKMEPMSGMMWMDFSDEYDFNSRTAKKKPEGVNRDELLGGGGKDHPDEHAITVGDLCFVALGQIVNRNFEATRYQPTGGLVVSSPTYSAALRKVILADWKDLSKVRHRQLLIEDFVKPDYEGRRVGAYLRLAYYYPDAVESLLIEELAKPTFDVFIISEFCRETLYKTDDKAQRREKYDDFIRQHGEHFAAGVMDQLFGDLYFLEAHERGALSPPLTDYATQPRELLIQLFDQPADVKSEARPILTVADESERARLIESLIHDDSQKVGNIVKELFLKSPDDDYFAPACLRCLAARGYGKFLVEQLNKIDLARADADHVHRKYIESVTASKDPTVRAKLLDIVKTTTNDAYFMAALPAIERKHDELVLRRAGEIVAGMPEDTQSGGDLLSMLRERLPQEKAKELFKSFLATGSANRAETMCVVLWYGDPLAIEILAPLLSDRRLLPGFSQPTRVCDRAAQAISHASKELKFDSEASEAERDRQIKTLQQHCRDAAHP